MMVHMNWIYSGESFTVNNCLPSNFSFNFPEVYWFWHAATYYLHLFLLLHCLLYITTPGLTWNSMSLSGCLFVTENGHIFCLFLSLSFVSVLCFMWPGFLVNLMFKKILSFLDVGCINSCLLLPEVILAISCFWFLATPLSQIF